MTEYFDKVKQAADYIQSVISFEPEFGIILGTGLDDLTKEIEKVYEIDYAQIPNFPLSTVEFHTGKLIFGFLSCKKIVAMQGRFHYYEGYSMQEITLPVRVMSMLGASSIIISNACGSVNLNYQIGSIMIIDDYINLLGDNPLRGINHDKFGPRFTDMSEPFSRKLIDKTEKIAIENNIIVHKGVYSAMAGPMLETRAEYRFLRQIGADVVGMSTVPETISARQMGMEVLGLSIVTDLCDPDNLKPVGIDEIIGNAKLAESNLTILISKLLESIK